MKKAPSPVTNGADCANTAQCRNNEEQARRALRSVSFLMNPSSSNAEKLAGAFKDALRQQAQFDQLADLLERFVRVAEDTADSGAAQAPAQAQAASSLWSRLFRSSGNTGAAPIVDTSAVTEALRATLLTVIEHAPADVRQSRNLKELSQRIKHEDHAAIEQSISKLAPALCRAASTTPGTGGTLPSTPVTSYNEVFLQLIENLCLPEDMQLQARIVKEKLLHDENPSDYAPPLRATVSLITDMLTVLEKEKAGFQAFLISLAQRLQDLEAGLVGTSVNYQELYKVGHQIGESVQTQVNDLESTITRASNIDDLKSKVKTQITSLRGFLGEYRKHDSSRQQDLEKELVTMRDRLGVMEAHSQQLRASLEEKHRQAILDPLTNLANRIALQERFQLEYATWRRYATPLALIIVDIDHFKNINDSFGHLAGDNALKYVAKLLTGKLRETDFIARYGGEEFVILLPHSVGEGTLVVAEKLRAVVETSRFHSDNRLVPITISLGIAWFHEGDTPESVFKRADTALYQAKNSGRNQYRAADQNDTGSGLPLQGQRS